MQSLFQCPRSTHCKQMSVGFAVALGIVILKLGLPEDELVRWSLRVIVDDGTIFLRFL